MPNDAKLGLVAGLVSVLVVAAVYFPKPPAPAPRAAALPALAQPVPPLANAVAPPRLELTGQTVSRRVGGGE